MACEGVKHALEVVGQRCVKLDPASVAWMSERESFRVQKRACESCHRPMLGREPSPDTPVHRIADHRMSDGGEVHPDLVRPAGGDDHPKER